jgi:TonB-linked SusC/RagA family outer membrane protein
MKKKLWYPIFIAIMKFSILPSFFVLFALISYANNTLAQKYLTQKITLNLHNVEVSQVFLQIEKLTHVKFIYSPEVINASRKVDVQVSKTPLSKVLDNLFGSNDIRYEEVNDYIILSKKQELSLSNFTIISDLGKNVSPPRTITGKILSETGEPLAGASVLLKGTSIGTSTDKEGNFSLTIPEENVKGVLVISSAGFTSKEVPLSHQTAYTVQLVQNTRSMNEVVVIGYGTVKRKDMTGAVSSVKASDITAIPVSNALEVLQGKISGLDISKSDGEAGAGLNFTLRGNRSLTASNAPLVLVDGVTYGTTLDLNTSDIASIEVLKDASSTAIYGSRGANGVILITTKKGRSGKASVSLSSYYGVQSPAGLPDIQTADQYVKFKREAYRTQGITDDQLIFNPGELTAIKDRIYTDWMREIIKNGSVQNHEISMNGGNERSTFNLSFGAYNEKGLLKNDNLKRYNGSIGLGYKLTDNIKIGANVIYTYKDNNKRLDPLNQANKILPFARPYDSAGNIILYPVLGSSFAISPLADEVPGAYIDNRISKRMFSSSYLDWKIIKDLLFKTTFGLDLQNDRRGYYFGKNTIIQAGTLSKSGIETNNTTNYTWENTLTYSKTFGIHDFNVLLGSSLIKNSLESVHAFGNDQVSDINSFYNLGSNASSITINSSLVESNLKSGFGRINYKLLDRYLVTATFRADGASVLASGHKWGYFPSVAAAWRINEERFMKNINVISNLKLRASYGVSGNSSVLPYQTLGSLGRSVYAFDETAAYGYYPKDISNPDLKWEKTTTTNAGVDFGFFDNRISGAIELYQSKTSDLLMQRILPSSSGFSSVLENVGKTKNKGLEIALSTVNISGTGRGSINWTTDFSYTRNKEEIVELAGGASRDLANGWFVGKPTSVFYDYKKTGIWQLGKESEAATYGQKPGDIKVLDVTNDGKITAADDRIIVGSPRPKYSFGINNNLKFHDFDLSAFVYGRIGQTILSEASGNYKINGMENGPNVDYWTPENPTNDHPRPDKNKTANSAYMSTLYYVDGSFVKIRDISLGYALPASVVQKLSLSRLRVYTTLKNFFTFSHMKPYDPERGGLISFPMTKQVVFGLNVNFK